MKTQGNLYKIKQDKLSKWREWCLLLRTTHKEEALETLKEEKNTHELYLIFQIKEDFYVAMMGVGENLPATSRELNQRHKAMKEECLEFVCPLENLLEFWNS